MAYRIPLQRQCQEDGCPRFATYMVRNSRNAEVGVYCDKHSQERLDAMNAEGAP